MNIVLLFSYGHLEKIADLEPFYKHLLRKHFTNEALERGHDLFESIGTTDPLTAITHRIGDALCKELTEHEEEEWSYRIGTKHSDPFVEDVVQECLDLGVKRILTVPLTPLSSLTGTAMYQRQVMNVAKKNASINVYHLAPYHAEDSFIEVMTVRLQQALRWLPNDVKKETKVIFTAHSMPGNKKVHKEFIAQYETLAARLMASTNGVPYKITYRSGGSLPQKWLGPDVLDVLEECAESGTKAVVICELLSILKNAEVINEIGRYALRLAHLRGLKFVQTEYLNDSFDFVRLLSNLCLKRLEMAPEQIK